MQERFKYINDHAQAYLQRHGEKLYCRRIDEATVGFDSLKKCPQGCWQKGSDTTLLLRIFEDFCDAHAGIASTSAILSWTYTAVANINVSFEALYRGGLWLDQHHGQTAARAGLNFLKAYGHLVSLTLAADRDRFPVNPKLHYLHHLYLKLSEDSERHAWSLNMIGTSVQMDEEPSLAN